MRTLASSNSTHPGSGQVKPPARRLVRQGLVLATLAALCAIGQAQPVTSDVAVPYYTPGHFMQGAYQGWYVPQAAEFAAQSATLPVALSAFCSAAPAAAPEQLNQAKVRWQATASAWDRLSSVQIGPLLQRRSARQIDFTPTRPELITRAIQDAPDDAAAMERVGTPAKGLPALEWLLWSQPAAPNTPACRYAVQVAQEISREAMALSAQFIELAAREPGNDEASSGAAMSELVNQWVGGLERLRWAHIDKPRKSQATGTPRGRRSPGYPRSASGQTGASWAAQWQALATLASSDTAAAPPAPGAGLVTLETYLRGRGLNANADALARSVRQADASMRGLAPGPEHGAALDAATASLAALKKRVESETASALQVNIGFTDADGD